MSNGDNQVSKKLKNFFSTSLKYYGKEIALTSNQHFSIDQISDPNKEQYGDYRYIIQYGFPQSGCVSIHFGYSQQNNSFTIDKVSVYAPPAGENIIMANFSPQTQVEEIGISINFGVDTGTQEHTSLSEIEANPNALKMLDIATLYLSKAQILGECKLAVPEGSKHIPCCDCKYIPNTKGKGM